MNSLSTLYDRDYILWFQETYELIKTHNLNQIDRIFIAERLSFCRKSFRNPI